MSDHGATNDLTTAQLLAQPGAQPPEPTSMTTDATSTTQAASPIAGPADLPDSTSMVLRVMQRHRISNDRVAEVLDRDKGTISRILSGAIAVPYSLVLWLWRTTGDDEIASHLGRCKSATGFERALRVIEGVRECGIYDATVLALSEMHNVQAGMVGATMPHHSRERINLDDRLDRAIAALLTLRLARDRVAREPVGVGYAPPATSTDTKHAIDTTA